MTIPRHKPNQLFYFAIWQFYDVLLGKIKNNNRNNRLAGLVQFDLFFLNLIYK